MKKNWLLIVFLTCLGLTSCRKPCYDPELERQYKNAFCTLDCPGVQGCDGNIYCNECEANRKGIRIKK